jgi:hypothetical protein
VGPIIVPTDEQMIAGPTRRGLPSSASQAAPAVHRSPNDTPYTARPASSAAQESPHPIRQPSTSRTPEASVIRHAWQQRHDRRLVEAGDEEQRVDEQCGRNGCAGQVATGPSGNESGGRHRSNKIRSDLQGVT